MRTFQTVSKSPLDFDGSTDPSWPDLFRPSTFFLVEILKTWMLATSAGMTRIGIRPSEIQHPQQHLYFALPHKRKTAPGMAPLPYEQGEEAQG
jgi:hypothetical protein